MACASPVQRISRHLECPVCLEIYDKPKALPCQHTFCLDCIKRTAKGDTIQCPSCKNFHRVPNGGPEEFPNNYTLLPMIDDLQQMRLQEEYQVPTSLNAEIALQSQQSLGDLAVDSLKEIEAQADSFDLIVNNLHTLQQTLDSKSKEVKSAITIEIRHLTKCLQEREQELHDKVTLHALAENSRLQTLKGEVAAEARHLRQMCDQRRQNVEKSKELTNEECSDLLRQGDQSLQHIAQMCKRYENVEYQTMEFSTDEDHREQICRGLRQYGRLSKHKEGDQVLLQRSRFHSLPTRRQLHPQDIPPSSMKKQQSVPKRYDGNATHLFDVDNSRRRSKSANDYTKESASFTPEIKRSISYRPRHTSCIQDIEHSTEGLLLHPEPSIKIAGKKEIASAKHAKGTARDYFNSFQNDYPHSTTESHKIFEGSEYDPLYPLGIAVLSSGKLAVASGSALRIFNSQGIESTPRTPLKTKKARVLADVCCLPDETIVATDSFNNEVLQFSANGRPHGTLPIQVFGRKLDKPIKPYGITCDRKGFLYICDRENKCVVVCRPNGIVARVIGPNQLKDPLYLTLHNNETVMYVTDCQAAAVLVFTVDGDFVRKVPKPNVVSSCEESTMFARFSRPAGIALTPDGTLMVCDSELNIVQLLHPSTGALKAVIGGSLSAADEANTNAESELERPMGVTFIESLNMIAVCDTANNRVQVFNWKVSS